MYYYKDEDKKINQIIQRKDRMKIMEKMKNGRKDNETARRKDGRGGRPRDNKIFDFVYDLI
jgi:hypothetical protein